MVKCNSLDSGAEIKTPVLLRQFYLAAQAFVTVIATRLGALNKSVIKPCWEIAFCSFMKAISFVNSQSQLLVKRILIYQCYQLQCV